jgi:hypothetical protein
MLEENKVDIRQALLGEFDEGCEIEDVEEVAEEAFDATQENGRSKKVHELYIY